MLRLAVSVGWVMRLGDGRPTMKLIRLAGDVGPGTHSHRVFC